MRIQNRLKDVTIYINNITIMEQSYENTSVSTKKVAFNNCKQTPKHYIKRTRFSNSMKQAERYTRNGSYRGNGQ